jgi:hypothetical protein
MVLNQEAKDEHMTHFQAFLNHFRGKPEPLFTFEKDDPPYVQTRLKTTIDRNLQDKHERWILSKNTAARLSYEYYRWKNKVGEEYERETDDDSRVALLVKNCECIILSEATQFAGFFQPRQEPPATPQGTAQGTKPTTSSV